MCLLVLLASILLRLLTYAYIEVRHRSELLSGSSFGIHSITLLYTHDNPTPSSVFYYDVHIVWPELTGVDVDEAVKVITKDCPACNVFQIPEGSPVTSDYRMDRVRVFFNGKQVVVGIPSIG